MISNQQVEGLMAGSGNVLGPNGDKIGAVGTFYLDDQTNEPAWVTVNTGILGTNESFVPLSEATVEGVDVLVPYSKDEVKNSPQVEADGSISPEEEVTLYRYYGFTYDDGSDDVATMDAGTMTDSTMTDSAGVGTRSGERSDFTEDSDLTRSGMSTDSTVGRDTSGPTTDDAMTRSEEQLDVGTRSHETGRARLRKYVVTETVTTEVPVSHEEVRIEREPVTDATAGSAMSGPELSEEEHEVTLHAEEPVVSKKTVPVERVRMDTETVTDSESVSEEVRKEQIETEIDDSVRRSSGTDSHGGSGHSGGASGGTSGESGSGSGR